MSWCSARFASRGRVGAKSACVTNKPGGQTADETPSITGGASLAERVARLEYELNKLSRQFAEFRADTKRYRNEE